METKLNILQVVHFFLPDHQTGTELYTYYLTKELKKLGHNVTILTFEDGYPYVESVMEKTHYEDIPLIKLYKQERSLKKRQLKKYMNLYYEPYLESVFIRILDELKPDVVHFQHLVNLSINFIELVKRRNIPVVMTIADYWYICWNNLLLKKDLSRCTPDRKLRNCLGCIRKNPVSLALLPYFYYHLLKKETLHKKNLNSADLIIAPSDFLREVYVAWGVDPDRIIHSDYGMEHALYPEKKIIPKNIEEYTFGFIGSILPHKGLGILIKAFNELKDKPVKLEIWGDLKTKKTYSKDVEQMLRSDKIKLMGRYENKDIGNVLKRFDALIIPSIWYENSPLTIHESYMCGVPLITSDIGGMAELVPHNVSGLQFKANNSDSLKETILDILDKKYNLAELSKKIPKVKPIRDNALEIQDYYFKLLNKT